MSDFPVIKDHLVANPDKYTMTTNPDGTVTLRPTWVDNPSEVLQEGTSVDAAFLSKIPEAIDAIDTKVTSQLDEKANKDYVEQLTQSLASGGPKGAYATGAALTTAFPAGNTNIYVVTADKNWYYWNGSAWTAGGEYLQASGVTTYTKLYNKILNGNFTAGTYWSRSNMTGSVASNVYTLTASAYLGNVSNGIGASVDNNKYYVAAKVKATSSLVKLQLFNAGTGAAWVDKSHSGSGTTERLSGTATVVGTNNLSMRVIDYRNSGWDAIEVSKAMIVNLTEIFGAGKEPSLAEFETLLGDNSLDKFFETELMSNVISGTTAFEVANPATALSKPLFVNYDGANFKVNQKYNATNDLLVYMRKQGVNNLWDFTGAYLKANSSLKVTNDTSHITGTQIWSNGSDSFAPYVVSAASNDDGDNQVLTHFTGGVHGYLNNNVVSAENTATARTSEVVVKVEGRKINTFEGYADFVELSWTNFVQANNTKKANGTGREVLKETFTLLFDGHEIKVDYRSEVLENVTIATYYGLQLVTGSAYNGGVRYHTSINRKWINNNGAASNGGDTKGSMFTVRNTAKTDYIDVAIEKTHGLGTRADLVGGTQSMFTTTANKTYMNLIQNLSLTTGDCLSFKGAYRFYSAS